MSKIIPWFWVYIFFIACMVIGAVILLGIAFMPIDTHAVCDPLINQTKQEVNFYCICQRNISWP